MKRAVKAENLRRQKNREKREARRAMLASANEQGRAETRAPMRKVADVPDSRRAGELDELDALRAGKTSDQHGPLAGSETTDGTPGQGGTPALSEKGPKLRFTARLTTGTQDKGQRVQMFTVVRPGYRPRATNQTPSPETLISGGQEESQPALKTLQTKLRDAEFQTELVKQLLQIMTNSQRAEVTGAKESDSVEGSQPSEAPEKANRSLLGSQSQILRSRRVSRQSDSPRLGNKGYEANSSMFAKDPSSVSSYSTPPPSTERLVHGELNMDDDTHQLPIPKSPAISSDFNASSVRTLSYALRASTGPQSHKSPYGDTAWDDDSQVDTLL